MKDDMIITDSQTQDTYKSKIPRLAARPVSRMSASLPPNLYVYKKTYAAMQCIGKTAHKAEHVKFTFNSVPLTIGTVQIL